MKNSILIKKLAGFTISNIVAMVIVGVSNYINIENAVGAGVLVFSEFVIVPMLVGYISAWYWKELNLRTLQITNYSLLNTLIAIALSAIFLNEGAICLIIVSPLIFCFIMGGVYIGRSVFKKNNQTLNVSVVSLMLLVFVADSLSDHNYQNMVGDTIIINAPPEKVWQHVVSFEKIKRENEYWLFRAGMPSPIASTVEGHYEGAGRKCIFSNGYTFDEKIVAYKKNVDLTFDIIGQPRDPEIMGHIDILRGQFLLNDNGNGTTTLTGNSWYKLYVFPVWYYDLWAESITRNVHLRVMGHIKELSEAK